MMSAFLETIGTLGIIASIVIKINMCREMRKRGIEPGDVSDK